MNEPLVYSSVWATAPPIIKTIFEHLPLKALNTCARVCTAWRTIACNVKKRRKLRISWLFYRTGGDEEDCYETVLKEQVGNLYNEPSFILLFGTKFPSNWPTRHETGSCELLNYLPSLCNSLFCSSAAVESKASCSKAIDPSKKGEGLALSALFFPTLAGVEITVFKLKLTDRNDIQSNLCDQNYSDKKPLKCLLIFHDRTALCCNRNESLYILFDYLVKTKGQLAVGGAYTGKVNFQQDNSILEHSFGVAFSGTNVDAASIIIPPEIQTADGIEQKLKVLLDTNILQGQCIAFIFTSIAGKEYITTQNVGTCIFKKLFPTIPLFSLFGDGVLGHTYFPNVSVPSDNSCFILSGYDLAFIVISLKN